MEDTRQISFLTIYASHKIATCSPGDGGETEEREALPHWCVTLRGVQYEDGLYLPTKDNPLTDGMSGATPRGSFDLKLNPASTLKQFVVKVEINHSDRLE